MDLFGTAFKSGVTSGSLRDALIVALITSTRYMGELSLLLLVSFVSDPAGAELTMCSTHISRSLKSS